MTEVVCPEGVELELVMYFTDGEQDCRIKLGEVSLTADWTGLAEWAKARAVDTGLSGDTARMMTAPEAETMTMMAVFKRREAADE